ncbi:3-dehydro-L-gulonate 2-dehydrogenase [Algoriphagus halophytocola]|uniref:3-dehydro-L-gulonate 2-dehydrogenase n=1 Tax=Algoriphagus halophytocola TaxID=2991499 RepID=A0ABY6ML87_9BACT|nr:MULTISPECIES: 3-dehydro-L-gulonate 2-dehydrogenase [unclassified Algoriphagus]UZD24516.1 3-dehydro-L-gulonate 2-dehydrogenase [Algoriphagus sp. TR-M5]WBL41880.1 3-dehydro-L-gulonate 2-dehydrogenase [Algoriphagus sp. TR-M9]
MNDLKIPFEELKATLFRVLLKYGFTEERARQCAALFAKTDLDGVRSHGVNRFPLFLEFIKRGHVKPEKTPSIQSKISMFERWDGNYGPGNLNAKFAMERAISLAGEFGIGCVSLAHTNHWMRGGNFGWQAVEAGCIGVCFTNTKANMPAWGGSEPKLGNNPLVIGIPRAEYPVVLDMAMSLFAYGKMALYKNKGQDLPFEGGFDSAGSLTKNPSEIIENELALPMGLWKGAGFSLVLDMLAAILSGGDATHEVDKSGDEFGLSQVFLCFDPSKLELNEWMEAKAEEIINDLKSSSVFEGKEVRYPGEGVLRTRRINTEHGIPVDAEIWDKINKELES